MTTDPRRQTSYPRGGLPDRQRGRGRRPCHEAQSLKGDASRSISEHGGAMTPTLEDWGLVPEDWVSPEEAADFLGVDTAILRRARKRSVPDSKAARHRPG